MPLSNIHWNNFTFSKNQNVSTPPHMLNIIQTALFVLFFAMSSAAASPVWAQHGDVEEIVVISARHKRSLDDTPLRVQVLGAGELREKANMKPGDIRMLLNESTGIQVQQTSATSFNSSIRIQGLDGRYTQLLRDGLPIYSGFSGGLSLLQITPLDLQQVEVIKGASSTLYGGGAIAGLVNLVSKRPGKEPETSVMMNGTSAKGVDLSAFHSQEIGKHGFTLFGSYNRGSAYEAEKNGLTAIPKFERVTLTPRWFYEPSNMTSIDLGIGFINENRLGGNIDYIKSQNSTDYFEANDSKRIYTRAGLTHQFGNGVELSFKNADSWYDRSLETRDNEFAGNQFSTFTELSLSNEVNKGSWVLGANAITEKFNQDPSNVGYNHNYSENVFGVFGQYTQDISSTLVVEGGLRVDEHSEYGSFVLPRVSVLFTPTPDLTMRLGGGFGYKTPNLFITEAEELQFRNLMPLDPANFDGETSKGVNFDINHRLEISSDLSLTSNLLLFYTKIDNMVQINEQNGNYTFNQLEDRVDTQGIELNLAFGFGEIKYFLGYTYVDARKHTVTGIIDLPMVSKHRVNQVLVWEKEDDFRIGLEAYFFSKQKRENDTTGKSYWIMGLMTEKKVNQSITAFLNFENYTDTRQTKFEIINRGDLINPDFRDIYAPLDGFVINGGLRVSW